MRALVVSGALLGCFASAPRAIAGPIVRPLQASTANPNYFVDGNGKAVVLTGSHTWNDLQDWGAGAVETLDFDAYVGMLSSHGQNFTLLWRTELPHFCGLPTGALTDYDVAQQPWLRPGPGTATDGKPKFDLTQFDASFFDRLRARVSQLNDGGIYAGVYLFTGEWLMSFRCGNDGYPLTGANNVNGIDDGSGTGSITMTGRNAITAVQDAFVQKTVDTLNDLPNVLWIVSEEAPSNSAWWNGHVISLVKSYESGKPLQHPVGWATLTGGTDAQLYDSDADWVAPLARLSPTRSCGTGSPACKVNVNDSDHSYFGMWNDSAQTNRNYFWENFTNGDSVIFMDPYTVYYPREGRNNCPSPDAGICIGPDPRWENVRATMGYIRALADRMNLIQMTPQANLSSTGNALARATASGSEVLVYSPSGGAFTVDLSFTTRTLSVEWLNPQNGALTTASPVVGGSSSQSFNPPFSGDAVLHLLDSSGADGGVDGGQAGTPDAGARGDAGGSGADSGPVEQDSGSAADAGSTGKVTAGCGCGATPVAGAALLALLLAIQQASRRRVRIRSAG
jgi:hypothetical protein